MGSNSDRRDDPAVLRAKAETKRKADKLVKDTGIPPQLAWMVARGDATLNEVLQKLALRDRVEGLIKRHDLPRSLATQVAMGQADLERVLRKRRLESHLEAHREKSLLLDACAAGGTVHLALHGRRWVSGVITAVDRYEFALQVDGEEQRHHKLQVKYGVATDDGRPLRRAVKKDKATDADAEPIWKPQDRYGCSDRRLFGYLDAKTTVRVVTLEGDLLQGTLTWMGRWEFGMELKKGATVTVFRHALADLRSA